MAETTRGAANDAGGHYDYDARSDLNIVINRLSYLEKHPWLTATPSDLHSAVNALAAERDRADRAETRLREARKAIDANQTVGGVTDRGWLTPDEWLLDKVAEALGEDEATV